jgi:hypothetical protein
MMNWTGNLSKSGDVINHPDGPLILPRINGVLLVINHKICKAPEGGWLKFDSREEAEEEWTRRIKAAEKAPA